MLESLSRDSAINHVAHVLETTITNVKPADQMQRNKIMVYVPARKDSTQ